MPSWGASKIARNITESKHQRQAPEEANMAPTRQRQPATFFFSSTTCGATADGRRTAMIQKNLADDSQDHCGTVLTYPTQYEAGATTPSFKVRGFSRIFPDPREETDGMRLVCR